jgi:hypothetical protein
MSDQIEASHLIAKNHQETAQSVATEVKLAEGEGFEPPVRLPVRLISSQVPLTTQPPFRSFATNNLQFNEKIRH